MFPLVRPLCRAYSSAHTVCICGGTTVAFLDDDCSFLQIRQVGTEGYSLGEIYTRPSFMTSQLCSSSSSPQLAHWPLPDKSDYHC